MRAAAIASTPLLSALLWVVAMILTPGALDPTAALLVGVGLLLPSVVAMVGMVASGGLWAWRTALAATAASLGPALLLPIGAPWGVALAGTGTAVVGLSSPMLRSSLRRLPAAAGPPLRSVVIALVLVFTPYTVGLAGWEASGAGDLAVGLTAPVAALWYTRVLFGGLLGIRVAWPALALLLVPALRPWPAGVAAATALLVTVLAWHRSVKTAFHPPQERGTTYPIPPELAPPEIRDGADIDEKGRKR